MWPETRFPDGYRQRGSPQASAPEVQIGRHAGDKQPMDVLLKTAIAVFGETEHALDDAEGMLDFVYDTLVPIMAMGGSWALEACCRGTWA